MSRSSYLGAALMAATLVGGGAPSLAQGTSRAGPGDERVNQVIVYGDDPCPRASSPDEITVCARKSEAERYRIPAPLRGGDKPPDRAWTDRVLAYETVGRTGTNSCSTIGAGGFTGCTQQLVQQAYAEKAQSSDVQFGKMIADERAKRLSTVDADAAATQARVEAEERADAAKRGSMAAPDAAGVATTPAPGASASPPASGGGN